MSAIIILKDAYTGNDVDVSVDKIISYTTEGHLTFISLGTGNVLVVQDSVADIRQTLNELYFIVKRPGSAA